MINVGKQGLYDPRNEHDACGVGFLVNIKGQKTHDMIERAIHVLERLLHRGATGGDSNTGDGAGILIQIPDEFFRSEAKNFSMNLPPAGSYGVALIFMPPEIKERKTCQKLMEEIIQKQGFKLLGFRAVACDSTALGEKARREQPFILQCFVCADGLVEDALERELYILRREIENQIEEKLSIGDQFYIVSFSCRTIVYKGLMMATQISDFYKDLKDDRVKSALAVVHQRYSTNTFPSWKLAQPFRYLAHNGEINTLRGNLNQMKAREQLLASDLFGEKIKKIFPIVDEQGSDSACLDNVFELLVNGGRKMPHAMMMLVPQAWGVKYPIGPDLKGFFEYHAGLMEPWDGPAAVAFSDGKSIGALLDRNGLRPCRYTITKDDFMVLSSEAGVLDFHPSDIAERGSLRPGEIIFVDLEKGRLQKNTEVKTFFARKQPYRRWVNENHIELHGLFNDVAPLAVDRSTLLLRQRMFGYTREDLKTVLGPMAIKGEEPVGSMGCDTPLAVLSEKPQLLYYYFKQLFAQITNPAIDPIREELVMSLMTFMGLSGNILSETPQNSRLVKLIHPFLSNEDLERLHSLKVKNFWSTTLQMGFSVTGKGDGLAEALDRLCRTAEVSVRDGCSLITLSDRDLSSELMPIPALLAVSAVHQHLTRLGLRTHIGLIVETAEAREVHHMATLLGFGATAINPYLAFETIADMTQQKILDKDISVTQALENYLHALQKGLLKIMSKMGISTLRSYRGAQVFEAIGLNNDVIEKYFTGTASRIEGIGLEEIAQEVELRYQAAFANLSSGSSDLPNGGQYAFRKDGERHLWTPEAIYKLQTAARNNDPVVYKEYSEIINDQEKKQYTIRGLFRFKKTKSISIQDVEPAVEIMKRFATSAMSFGSISPEAHETLAIAMNRIGAMSNSGEGGEDPRRYTPEANGDNRCSAVKQVASGRFGVTAEYLVNAREIQIKIAQGAKPGEGGQLPGHKVNDEIARVRHSTPGVTLISPPPHHDIYSIEDIKQLIFDLKNVNPKARVSVKLVSEVGVGTIAAGVAKAHADMVLISGYDGGTGASPLSSIKHAGMPWELGLSETQQTLVLNNLRSRIRIQTDGQMKTGRDIVIAALLGAEEFGFGTAPLIVCGCVMMRKCHLNTCSVGVATQDPVLRKNFKGKPEYVVNFFSMLAEEVRHYMAQLGFKTLDEMVGRADLLEVNPAIDFWKTKGLDFSKIFFSDHMSKNFIRQVSRQEHKVDQVLDKELIERAKSAIERKERITIDLPITNTQLTTGAMLSGEIAKRHGYQGLPEDSIICRFQGSAGQSFGAFASRGMTLILEGEANDYLGKGLCGGKIIVKPLEGTTYHPSDHIICGNVLFYGATSGEAYIYGRAGERFAIRNSGASIVVEGIGDHGCEYMTGGRVVILGDTGINFAAGMSGGLAYVYDPQSKLDNFCNLSMVDLEIVIDKQDIFELRQMITQHFFYTQSERAKYILDFWEQCLPYFVKVFPMEYRRVLGKMMKDDEQTEREEQVFK